MDGLAQTLKKDVPSCDKPRGDARILRTEDFLIGPPDA